MNETTPAASRSAPVLTAVLILVWMLGFGGGAAWIVFAQLSGEPTTALIESCEHRAKPATYVCRGTWTLAGATTTGGIVEGVDNEDVGDEVEVRVKGERAYSLSLRLPIVLGVLALSFPVLYVGDLLRSRLAPSMHHPRKEALL